MATSIATPTSDNADTMLSGFSSDIFSGVADTPVSEPEVDAPAVDEIETPDDITDVPADEPTEPEVTTPEAPPEATTEPVTEEPIEGVSAGKSRQGKDGFFVQAERWQTDILPAYRLGQEAAKVIGEPLTLEAIQVRDQALEQNMRMFTDLNGDEASQGKLVNFLFQEMERAHSQGETGADPRVSFATTFFQQLESQPNSPARAALRHEASKALGKELYQHAAATGDKALFISVSHVIRALSGLKADASPLAIREAASRMGYDFHLSPEMENLGKSDPIAEAQREIQQLREQLNGRQQSTAKEQVATFINETNGVIDKGIDGVVSASLATLKDAYKDLPEQFQRLIAGPTKTDVVAKINEDAAFRSRISVLKSQAQRATSASARTAIQTTIKNAYENKAKLVVDAIRQKHATDAARIVKSTSDSTHARRSAAQTKTAPKGPAGNVQRSIVPDNLGEMPNGVFDTEVASKAMAEAFRRAGL